MKKLSMVIQSSGILEMPKFLPGMCLLLVFVTGFLFSGCQKDMAAQSKNDLPMLTSSAVMMNAGSSADAEFMNMYTGLSKQTTSELQQARAATARYRDIKNALKDDYADIMVDVEGMGHHFMKTSIVDGIFNIREPEILVYNRREDGTQELVALEYATVLYADELQTIKTPRPEGFTGSGDVWTDESGFPFWLVHAWVWQYNPDGVFNWTNPLVHLH